MLVEFGVSNFRSFRQETTLSMLASRQQAFRERIPYFESKYRTYVLPVAGIYGANASGKTNFFRAIAVLRSFVLQASPERRSLPYFPFKIDPTCASQPSSFRVLFIQAEQMYEYSLSFVRTKVVFESLVLVRSQDEVDVFTREEDSVVFGEGFGSETLSNMLASLPPHMPVVSLLAPFSDGKIPSIGHFTAPHRWLQRVFPLSAGFQNESHSFPLSENEVGFISGIGAGVNGVAKTEVPLSELGLSEEKEVEFLSELASGALITLEKDGIRYEAFEIEGKPSVFRISLKHGDVPFDWGEESDGTRAAAKLYPFLWSLTRPGDGPILLIDEIDRSFHTLLTKRIIEAFLSNCNADSRAQLLFTTHDLLLMDPDTFRRDEIWVMEKNRQGESTAISLVEYKGLRNDKDLRKAYLQGRFGGIPAIGALSLCPSN